MHKDIKVVFMGTPEFAVPILDVLQKKTNVVLVVTQPDKEVGRKKEISASPIKRKALEYGLEVFQPAKIREDFARIRKLNPDLIVTCAYGQILPQELLDIPALGSVNVHASLLPKYRGSAPIQHAILNGDEKTGITLMYMDAGMDTGDMFAKVECNITTSDTYGSLHDKLMELGANLLEENLDDIINKKTKREKQDESKVTFAPRITREDELIDINETGKNIINKIRAFNPYPLAYFNQDRFDFKVLKASFNKKENPMIGKVDITKNSLSIEVEDGIIYFEVIKPIGKNIMDIKNYLNGLR